MSISLFSFPNPLLKLMPACIEGLALPFPDRSPQCYSLESVKQRDCGLGVPKPSQGLKSHIENRQLSGCIHPASCKSQLLQL